MSVYSANRIKSEYLFEMIIELKALQICRHARHSAAMLCSVFQHSVTDILGNLMVLRMEIGSTITIHDSGTTTGKKEGQTIENVFSPQ